MCWEWEGNGLLPSLTTVTSLSTLSFLFQTLKCKNVLKEVGVFGVGGEWSPAHVDNSDFTYPVVFSISNIEMYYTSQCVWSRKGMAIIINVRI